MLIIFQLQNLILQDVNQMYYKKLDTEVYPVRETKQKSNTTKH